MKKLSFILVAVLILASCEKDPVANSKHRFSSEQQKAVETFVGNWEGVATSYFTKPDCLSFGWHSDTNVVMYKDDYLHGRVEEFEYQGEVVLRTAEWVDGVYDYVDVPCWYYVSPLALTIDLYRKDDHRRIWKYYDIEFVSASQFKVRYVDGYNSPWLTLNKIEND